VLKKTVQITMTLGMLLVGYTGYVRGFGFLMDMVTAPAKVKKLQVSMGPSEGARKASELAALSFGANHWSADPNKSFRYYEPGRGIWLYAESYEPLDGNKKLKLTPVAMAVRTKEGGEIKTLTADRATLEFDRPLEPGKPGSGAAHVIRAKMEGNVVIRNNKGTIDRLDDDLIVGPLAFLEFDESKLEIKGEAAGDAPVRVKDKGLLLNGRGVLRIALQPKSAGMGGGFDARSAELERDIHIVMDDVGSAGVVPVTSNEPATPSSDPAKPPVKRVPKPGELRSSGKMVVYLPKPKLPVKVGPPPPKGPTLAEFFRNVVVRQGVDNPDQLNSDHLHMTLTPAEKAEQPPRTNTADVSPAEAAAGDDTLGSLTLSSARATGHAVWIQSPQQGLKVLGTEAIFERHLPDAPDKTYIRNDRLVWVEKTTFVNEGPDKGKVQSIDEINTVDLTIFQFGTNGGPPTLVGRGPGTMETREARGMPIDRFASWDDRMEVQNVRAANGERRKITLTGQPKVHSRTQGKIEARDTIIAFLKPKVATPNETGPKDPQVFADGKPVKTGSQAGRAEPLASATDPASSPAPKAQPRANDAYEIEWLEAHVDVVLETVEEPPPAADSGATRKKAGKQTVKARNRLDVAFAPAPKPKPPTAPNDPAGPVEPAAAAKPDAAAPVEVAQADPPAKEGAAADAPPVNDPPLVAEGDEAWARVLMYPDDGATATQTAAATTKKAPQGYVEKAYLRGNVTVHQDPAPGKKRGTDITADKIDMIDQGDNLSKVTALGSIERPAVAITDGFNIRGPLLGLDQKADYAWVDGPGKLIQEKGDDALELTGSPTSDRADLKRPEGRTENRAATAKAGTAKTAARKPKGPVTVTWKKEMRFYGKTIDDRGVLGPARADFEENVHAWTEDSTVNCQTMVAMLDGPVSLRKGRGEPGGAGRDSDGEKKPDPKITWVKCLKDVDIHRYVFEPETKVFKGKDRIRGDDVFYDMPTGFFDVLGAGTVWHYARKGDDAAAPAAGGTRPDNAPSSTARRSVRPVSDSPARPRGPTTGLNKSQARTKAAPKRAKDEPPTLPPLELTRVAFRDRMVGTFGGGGDEEKPKGPTDAVFKNVREVLHAAVPDEKAELNADDFNRPEDLMQLACRTLRLESEPAPEGSGNPDRSWLTAWTNVTALDFDKSIFGDRLTYDSSKELIWVYGDQGRLATITQQKVPGARPSTTTGKALMHNRITGQAVLVDPNSIEFIDPKSFDPKKAKRLGPTAPSVMPDAPRQPRLEPRLPGRADKERRGFRS
jgi:hypothetical protein